MTYSPRIAVVGAGANGAAVAAAFVQAGHSVTIYDPWPENVLAMQLNGVIVRHDGHETSTPVDAFSVCDIAKDHTFYDVIVIGVKAYDTRWIAEMILPILSEDGIVVGIQNGMTLPDISAIAGESRSIGCVIEVAASMFVPGIVEQQVPLWFGLGATSEIGQRSVHNIVNLFDCAGQAEAISDITSAKWMKLVANTAELVTSAILDLPLAEAVRLPGMLELMRGVGEETATIAVKSGHKLTPIFNIEISEEVTPESYARDLLDGVLNSYTHASTLTTVLQDWRKGRRAEIEEIHGFVVDTGRTFGCSVEMNQHVLNIARNIEDGTLSASPQNLSLLTSVLPTR